MPTIQLTRGSGRLENYLSQKRAFKTNQLIPQQLRGGRILDIGCGRLPYFLLNTDFKEKYGIDPSADAGVSDGGVIIDRSFISPHTPLVYEDGFFQVVTMLGVIEHFSMEVMEYLFGEIYRVLADGGRFIVTTPAAWTGGIIKGLSTVGMISREEIVGIQDHYPFERLEQLAVSNGFEYENIHAGHFEFYLNTWTYFDK